ncbi:hypothetical protein WJX72_006594 [[Myrmecia] bisecta]|uniref:Uncharacterized protein n=1 Tax=[Myrmecia] bisecta TaxID=41462 RepID=A0AAW1PLP2_9CHLO
MSDSHFSTLSVTVSSGVAVVELARPSKFNAVSREMFLEMPQVMHLLDGRDDVRVIILKGQGRHFCAGIDFAALANNDSHQECPGRYRERLRRSIMAWQEAFTAIERCRWPVIAAVHGACIGAGIDMITACDIRYCTQDAYFCVKEVDLAITADMGTLQRLPRIVGQGRASELALTARTFKGPEAQQMGLVTECFPDAGAMLEAAERTAARIAARSPLAILGTKRVLQHSREHSVADGLEYVATWNAAMLPSSDLQEVLLAMAQRREPKFAKL